MGLDDRIKNNIKRSLGSLTKQEIIDAYNYFDGKCPYSDEYIKYENMHIDHIIPIKMGGTTDSWNCVPVCDDCNLKKSSMHPLDYWDMVHDSADEYKLEKIFNYICECLSKTRKYGITTYINTSEIEKFIDDSIIEEDMQEANIKLDTFMFLYQLVNHLKQNGNYLVGDINEYIKRLNDLYNANEQYITFNTEVFKKEIELTNYLKEIGVTKHYSISQELVERFHDVDINQIKNNVTNIENYLGMNIASTINKNPDILLMSTDEFTNKLDYLENFVHISRKLILNKPIFLSDLENAKKLVEVCKLNNYNIEKITDSAFDRINSLGKFVKMIQSEEFKEHPEMFTSTTLAHAKLGEIQELLNLDIWEDSRYKDLLTSTIVAKSKSMITKIPILINMVEYYEIDRHLNVNFLLKSPSQNYALINYFEDNGIPLVIDGKLNSLFSYQPGVLKKKYNIDINELIMKYPFDTEQFNIDKGEKKL